MSEIEWMDVFGDNLAQMMNESKMSQRELADEIGVHESTISHYINKQRIPSIKHVLNISYVLDCGVDELIYVDEKIE